MFKFIMVLKKGIDLILLTQKDNTVDKTIIRDGQPKGTKWELDTIDQADELMALEIGTAENLGFEKFAYRVEKEK